MTFRSDEDANKAFEQAVSYLIGRSIDHGARARSRSAFCAIVDQYGPVVASYPTWHPLLIAEKDPRSPSTRPGTSSGYVGLDHTVFLRNAVVTCPYVDNTRVFESVEKIAEDERLVGIAKITAEAIDAQLYAPDARPVLIACHWTRKTRLGGSDGLIPSELAIPLFLEREMPAWRTAQVAEAWKDMAPYLFGRPYGSRSSLLVSQETGQLLKDLYLKLVQSGMYGPQRMGST